MPVYFSDEATEELKTFFRDYRTLSKIYKLIEDIRRNGPLNGLGRPEALKNNLNGFYSRQIDDKNRLVYKIADDNTIMIYKCAGHYNDK